MMIHNYDYTSQYGNMQIAYDSLYTSFMRRDRKAIEYDCRNWENLGIGQFHEKANMEMERIYSLMGIRTIPTPTTLEQYALSIAEIISPDDKRFANASASVLALQTIDTIFNNKSGVELTKHTPHIATDFLASNVKESLNDTNAKRSVAVSALMVNLAIDFLVKD